MNEVEGHYSFWQYRNWLHRKKKGGGERKKEETEYSKTVRAVHSPMDGQILMHFVLFFYFFLNEI